MLAVPSAVGLWQAWQTRTVWASASTSVLAGMAGRVAMVVAFFVGYFCFHAVSVALKARRHRSDALRIAELEAIALVMLALVCWRLLGWGLFAWAVVYAPLMTIALLLVAVKRERSLLSGGVTIAAASLFATTLRLPVAWPGWSGGPGGPDWLGLALATVPAVICFLYFFGTVFVVKTMIRQRGSRVWFAASVAHHVLATVVAAALLVAIGLHWLFIVFFTATLVRAIALPLRGPLATPPRTITPKQVGLIEAGFSVALLLIFLVA